jgi:hypothetical protein
MSCPRKLFHKLADTQGRIIECSHAPNLVTPLISGDRNRLSHAGRAASSTLTILSVALKDDRRFQAAD